MNELNIPGDPTVIIIRYLDVAHVLWRRRSVKWEVYTGPKGHAQLTRTFPTMAEACEWASGYAAHSLGNAPVVLDTDYRTVD